MLYYLCYFEGLEALYYRTGIEVLVLVLLQQKHYSRWRLIEVEE